MGSYGLVNFAQICLYQGITEMFERSLSWKDHVPATFSSILFILQIVVGAYLLSEVSQIEILAYLGVGLYFFSGMIFGVLPIFEFRKKGEVKEGKSYIHTTKLVDTGIYSVVRHPQYLTFILFAIAGFFLFQHWIIILLGLPIVPLAYLDLIKADNNGVDKFGEKYKIYMKKVPRTNFLLGIIRKFSKSE